MKNTTTPYHWWTWAFRSNTSLCVILQTIPTLSLAMRKDVLTLSRCQSPLIKGSRIEAAMSNPYATIMVPSAITPLNDAPRVWMSFWSVMTEYSDAYLSPISASVLALAVRIAPDITEEDMLSTIRTGLHTEVSASITYDPPERLDFRCIFGQHLSNRFLPLHKRLEPNEEVATSVYVAFCEVRERLRDMVIFPTLGNKRVGDEVSTIMFLMREIRRQDPDGEHSPLRSLDGHRRPYMIPPRSLWGRVRFNMWFRDDLAYDEKVRVYRSEGDDDVSVYDTRVGSSHCLMQTRGREFLSKLGYVAKEDLFDEVSIADVGQDMMLELLDGRYRSSKRYTVVREIPKGMRALYQST